MYPKTSKQVINSYGDGSKWRGDKPGMSLPDGGFCLQCGSPELPCPSSQGWAPGVLPLCVCVCVCVCICLVVCLVFNPRRACARVTVVNPRRACARVTVVVLCVCVCIRLFPL